MKKVTAKHLMIGDWVESRGKVKKVHGMSPFTNKIGLNKYIYDGEIEYDYVKSATPIPITEDIISMLNKVHKYTTITYYSSTTGLLITDFNNPTRIHWGIQYIHQLQQAYRLATGGKELKIKF